VGKSWTCYSTEQGPSLAANRFSAIQKSPAFYGTWWFITAYTRARHLSLPWATSHQPILPSNFLKIHLYITPHLCLVLPSGFFPSVFPTQTLYTSLRSPIHATCPANLILLYFITRIILDEEYISLSSSLCGYRTCNNVELCEQWRTAFRIHGDPNTRRL